MPNDALPEIATLDADGPGVPMVPPGSSPQREMFRAIQDALALPAPAATRDELTYLRASRDRSRLVRTTMNRLLRDRELSDRDLLVAAAALRGAAADLPDSRYDHHPMEH